jgi:hypothetical protein
VAQRGAKMRAARAMDKDYLELRRAALSRRSDERNDDDFDVLMTKLSAVFSRPTPHSWDRRGCGHSFPHHEGRASTHRYEPTREAAMAGRSSHGLAKRQKKAPSVP